MRVIRKDFFSASDLRLKLYPIGDIHIGAAACDEDALRRHVARIASEPESRWIGMGDYIEAINRRDKRFDPTTLAPWISAHDLKDLATIQKNYFLSIIQPIAHQCLGLLNGNHEDELANITERDLYGDIVADVKRLGGFAEDDKLRLGYYGWLQLSFFKGSDTKGGSRLMTVNAHHGAGGGKLSGGVINSLEGWLARHQCDIAIWGHSHKTANTSIAVESVCPRSGRIRMYERHGVISSTYLRSYQEDHDGTYGERKALWPLAHGRPVIELYAHAPEHEPRVKVSTS